MGGTPVHVVLVVVLAAHAPDEGVVAGRTGAVDAPLRADDGLLVVHPDVAGLLGLAHEVADGRVFGDFEVEIDLHAAVVRVGGHRVPGAAGREFGHAHLKLAAGDHLLDQQAVDRALIALLQAAQVHHDGVFLADLLDARLAVRGGGAEIEMRRMLRIHALERDVAVAAVDIEDMSVDRIGSVGSQEDGRFAQLAGFYSEVQRFEA